MQNIQLMLKYNNIKKKPLLFAIISIVAAGAVLCVDILRLKKCILAFGVAPIGLIISIVCYFVEEKGKQIVLSAIFVGVYLTIISMLYLVLRWAEIPVSIY